MPSEPRPGEPTPTEVAAAVLRAAPVVDGHNDLPFQLRRRSGSAVDGLATGRPDLHTDLPRLRAGGVGAQFWSVFVPSHVPEPEAVVGALEQIDVVHRMVAAYPADLVIAHTAADVARAAAAGRIACLLGVEGGHSIATSPAVLRALARLGVRYLTLTHNDNTSWADSATDEPRAGGLTDAGRAVVAELGRIGVLADLSHVAATTMHAALDVATAPVIFSHSSCRAVCDHPRNVPDDVLVRLAGNGGVVQVTFVAAFVSSDVAAWEDAADAERERLGLPTEEPDWSRWCRSPAPGETPEAVAAAGAARAAAAGPPDDDPAMARWLAANPMPRATVAQVADHVDHARAVAGVDHVGLGGDYDGTDALPDGLEDVSGYPRLVAELADRGWPGADLEKLTGRNVLRVLADAESAATEPLWPPSPAR